MYKPYLRGDDNIKRSMEFYTKIININPREQNKQMNRWFIDNLNTYIETDKKISEFDDVILQLAKKIFNRVGKIEREKTINAINLKFRFPLLKLIDTYKNICIILFDIAMYLKDKKFIYKFYKNAIDILGNSTYELVFLARESEMKGFLKKIFKDVYINKNSKIELCDIEDQIILDNDTYLLNIMVKYYFINRGKDELSQDLQNVNGYDQFLESPELRNIIYEYFKSIYNSIEKNKQVYRYLACNTEEEIMIKKLMEISNQWHLYNFIKRQLPRIEKMNNDD